MPPFRIIEGDCIEVMRAAKQDSVHALICDPPYAIEFMGKTWDSPKRMVGDATGISGGFSRIPAGTPRPDMKRSDPVLFQQWCEAWATEALRVLKPGGHMLAFGSPRTYHRLTTGLEDAGFEIRDCIMWTYATGMPKGRDLGRQIDKALGAVGPVVEETTDDGMAGWNGYRHGQYNDAAETREVRGPGCDESEPWHGWSSTLKPFYEPIVLARRPFKGPLFRNVLEHGTGGLNIKGCTIPHADAADLDASRQKNPGKSEGVTSDVYGAGRPQQSVNDDGRWPANLMIDESVAAELDAFSRFLYIAKPSTKERRAGLDESHGKHPTVKPIALMRELARLVTPPSGVILDPFCGSGTTGCAAMLEGFKFIGIETDPEHVRIAQARVAHWNAEAASC